MKIFSTPALLAIASANINPTHGNLFKSDTISLRRKKAKASKTSSAPSNEPSEGPSLNPTISDSPSIHPSLRPSSSSDPSHEPSSTPTQLPSLQPSASNVPTGGPSLSRSPSLEPSLSILPTQKSSGEPSGGPSLKPTISDAPSDKPSQMPSLSKDPSNEPSLEPSFSSTESNSPSFEPTESKFPTGGPTLSRSPSLEPSLSILPTSSGQISYQSVGYGTCVGFNGSTTYASNRVYPLSYPLDDCASACKSCESGLSGGSAIPGAINMFRGFHYDSQCGVCECLFDEGVTYSGDGECAVNVISVGTGRGPIGGVTPWADSQFRECYSFN